MKLIVSIPARNEANTIGDVIRRIPRSIPGIDEMGVLVIDDASQDGTAKRAEEAGAEVFSQEEHAGLGRGFLEGVKEALRRRADIIVTIDADLQYDAREIPRLIEPIQKGDADMVIGCRDPRSIAKMPFGKRWGNVWGTACMRFLLGRHLCDASSGFRAFSRMAAEKIRITSSHTYTHENIIQAVFLGFRMAEIPVAFHPRAYGSSRLIKNVWVHALRSFWDILRVYIFYRVGKKSI